MKIFLIVFSDLLILLVILLIGLSLGEKIYSYIYNGEDIVINYREFFFPFLIFLTSLFFQIKVAYWKNKITSIMLFVISSVSFAYNTIKINHGGFSWWFNIGYTLGIKEEYILISGIILFIMLFLTVIGSFIMIIN